MEYLLTAKHMQNYFFPQQIGLRLMENIDEKSMSKIK